MRSHSRGLVVIAALCSLLVLVFASPAMASKTVHSLIGAPGGSGNALDGGLFSTPRGVAVNVSGTGGASPGDVYVVNSEGNRVDQFTASGTFIRAFGRDVVEAGKANDSGEGFEICDVTAGNAAADCKGGLNSTSPGGDP